MATNKLLHFKTQNRFNQAIQNEEIPEDSIAFVQEGTDVYTHSTLYAHYDEYKEGGYNMNNCLYPGIYYNCILGRPIGSVAGESYILRVANIGVTSETKTIEIIDRPGWKLDKNQSVEGWNNYDYNNDRFATLVSPDIIVDSRPKEYKELYYHQTQHNSQTNNQRLFYYEYELPKSGFYTVSFDIGAFNTKKQNEEGISEVMPDSNVDVAICYNKNNELVKEIHKINTKEAYASPLTPTVSYNDIQKMEVNVNTDSTLLRIEVSLNEHSNANWFLFNMNNLYLKEPEMDVIEQTCQSENGLHSYRRILYSTNRKKYEPPFTLYSEWQSATFWLDDALVDLREDIKLDDGYFHLVYNRSQRGYQGGEVLIPILNQSSFSRPGLITYSDYQKFMTAYNVLGVTEDADDVINKFKEIEDFLVGIEETSTLKEIIEGIEDYVDRKSITQLDIIPDEDSAHVEISTGDGTDFIASLGVPQEGYNVRIGGSYAPESGNEDIYVYRNGQDPANGVYPALGSIYYQSPSKYPSGQYGNYNGNASYIIDTENFFNKYNAGLRIIHSGPGASGVESRGILKLKNDGTLIPFGIFDANTEVVISKEELETLQAVAVVNINYGSYDFAYESSKAGLITYEDKKAIDNIINKGAFQTIADGTLRLHLKHDSTDITYFAVPKATTSSDGVMSKADKVKLNDIDNRLLYIEEEPTIAFTTNVIVVYAGQSVAITPTVNFSTKSGTVTASQIGWVDDNDDWLGSVQNSNQYNTNLTKVWGLKNARTRTNVYGKAIYELNGNRVIKSIARTINAVDPILYGFTYDFVPGNLRTAGAKTTYTGAYTDTAWNSDNTLYNKFFFAIPVSLYSTAPTLTATMGGAPVALELYSQTALNKQGVDYWVYAIGGATPQEYAIGTTLNITIS